MCTSTNERNTIVFNLHIWKNVSSLPVSPLRESTATEWLENHTSARKRPLYTSQLIDYFPVKLTSALTSSTYKFSKNYSSRIIISKQLHQLTQEKKHWHVVKIIWIVVDIIQQANCHCHMFKTIAKVERVPCTVILARLVAVPAILAAKHWYQPEWFTVDWSTVNTDRQPTFSMT